MEIKSSIVENLKIEKKNSLSILLIALFGIIVAISGGIATISGGYYLLSGLIEENLETTPSQIIKSTAVKAEIKELNEENVNFTNEINNIKFIAIFKKSKEESPILFVPNSDNFNLPDKNSGSIKELVLQYASGSNEVYASNCPKRHKHGTDCYGPVYDGDSLVVPLTCNCVRN